MKQRTYPKRKREACPHCGTVRTLTRHGDGAIRHPRYPHLRRYWYGSDHSCPKLAGLSEENENLNRTLFKPKG
jgi:ribosomal protein S27AE